MTLISEINDAAAELIETQNYTIQNLKYLLENEYIGIEQLNESVQQFLNIYANKIANGKLENQDDNKVARSKDSVINIFAALKALSQKDLADSFSDKDAAPLGQILSDFYGKNGKEAHKIASERLNAIGQHPSVRTYRTQAETAVNNPEQITAFANKIRSIIDPVMNSMLSRERQQSQARQDTQIVKNDQKSLDAS